MTPAMPRVWAILAVLAALIGPARSGTCDLRPHRAAPCPLGLRIESLAAAVWVSVNSMPSSSSDHVAVSVGDRIFVMGGSGVRKAVEAYNSATGNTFAL